jgi:predicted deacylase
MEKHFIDCFGRSVSELGAVMFAPLVAKPKSRGRAPQGSTVAARLPSCSGIAQETTPGPSWDFSKIPLFPIQVKLKVGALDDPREHEADRAASQVMRLSAPGVSIGAAGPQLGRVQLKQERAAPAPDSFRGRGDPIPAPVRGFFEQRFGYDFGGVRVHHGADASQSAFSFGARAYTYGRDIVFGAGEYSSGSRQTAGLLAHELAHVVQQGAGHGLVQRSPLSDKIKDAWKADPKIEALLARLSQADVQTAQADTDVDAEIARILTGRADDLFVAQRIRKGELGRTTGAQGPKVGGKTVPRPIQATFIRGSTDRRALVIAGVHGSERQGMEVADRLIKDLGSQTPGFTTIIVPSLFPDSAARGDEIVAAGNKDSLKEMQKARESGPDPEKSTPTNRNFPPSSQNLADAKVAGGGTAVDKLGRAILPENLLLIELMERFHPERIISIHGTFGPGSAGVFYDPRSPNAEEDRIAGELAKGIDGGQELPPAVQRNLHRAHLAAAAARAGQTDRDLALRAAVQIDADTAKAKVKGRESRDMSRDTDTKATTKAEIAERRKHPSIAGNIGPKGAIDNASWSGGVPGGVSLGSYAPPRGMSVFTVEPPLNLKSADYPSAQDKIDKAARITELQAYADAVRTILLGAP